MKFFPNQKQEQANLAADLRGTSTAYLRKIISDTGRALAESQAALDEAWINAHRERTRALEQGAIALPQPAAYSIPRASLEVNLEMRGARDEEGRMEVVATPVNAETSKRRSLDVSLTSSLKMNFALLPAEETPAEAGDERRAALESEQVLEIAAGDPKLDELIRDKGLVNPNLAARYRPESRKWSVEVISGDTTVAVLLVDDASGNALSVVDLEEAPRESDIKPLGPPRIGSVTPLVVVLGDLVLVTGDNLGGLDLNGTRVYLGERRVVPAELTVERLQFKIEDDMTGGVLRVVTPQGDSSLIPAEPGADDVDVDTESPLFNVVVRAAPRAMEPATGYFDPVTRTGSVVKIIGGGMTPDTELEFTGGAVAGPFRVDDARIAHFRVPSGARPGPTALITRAGDEVYRVELRDVVYQPRPFTRKVSPLEARAGEYITITGNHLRGVQGIRVGGRDIDFTEEEQGGARAIVSEQMIALRIPDDAGDGSLELRAGSRYFDTRAIFYQVPRITRMPDFGIRGEIMEITGTGLGAYRDSLTVRFESIDGPVLSEVLYLDEGASPGVMTLACRVPLEAVTGSVAVLRAEIHSQEETERTSGVGERKLLVFEAGTLPEDIISVEHFGPSDD